MSRELRSISSLELTHVLGQHWLWVNSGKKKGKQAGLNNSCLAGMDLSKANLRFAKLNGSDLSGADFSGAFLEGAELVRSDLSHANFKEANLKNACLNETNLCNANFEEAYLEQANLSGANLIGANFRGAYVVGTDRTHATHDDKQLDNAIRFLPLAVELALEKMSYLSLCFNEDEFDIDAALTVVGLLSDIYWTIGGDELCVNWVTSFSPPRRVVQPWNFNSTRPRYLCIDVDGYDKLYYPRLKPVLAHIIVSAFEARQSFYGIAQDKQIDGFDQSTLIQSWKERQYIGREKDSSIRSSYRTRSHDGLLFKNNPEMDGINNCIKELSWYLTSSGATLLEEASNMMLVFNKQIQPCVLLNNPNTVEIRNTV